LAFSTDGGPGGPGFRGPSIPPIRIFLNPAESTQGASFAGTFGPNTVSGHIVNEADFRGISFYDESKRQIAAA
jgi:hypothetical protein